MTADALPRTGKPNSILVKFNPEKKFSAAVLYDDAGAAVAHAHLWTNERGAATAIGGVHVDEARQRQGFATELYDRLIERGHDVVNSIGQVDYFSSGGREFALNYIAHRRALMRPARAVDPVAALPQWPEMSLLEGRHPEGQEGPRGALPKRVMKDPAGNEWLMKTSQGVWDAKAFPRWRPRPTPTSRSRPHASATNWACACRRSRRSPSTTPSTRCSRGCRAAACSTSRSRSTRRSAQGSTWCSSRHRRWASWRRTRCSTSSSPTVMRTRATSSSTRPGTCGASTRAWPSAVRWPSRSGLTRSSTVP